MDFAFPHKIIHMKYLWKCIFCVPSQNNKYLLSVYFAFPHKIIHMEYLRRLRLKVLTGLEYHLPLNRPQGPSIELLCVLFYILYKDPSWYKTSCNKLLCKLPKLLCKLQKLLCKLRKPDCFFFLVSLQQNTYLPAYSVMGVHSLVPLTPSSLGHT